MQTFKYIIVGGGIAGTTAAETIRQRDPEGSIALVSDEPHRLYSRVALSKPNFFLGKLPFDSVWLKNKEWYAQNTITFLSGKKAVRLDPKARAITLDDATVLRYEKLLLAIGGDAKQCDIPGATEMNPVRKKLLQATEVAPNGAAFSSGMNPVRNRTLTQASAVSYGMNIFYLRTLDDAINIIDMTRHAKKGVILGGGFVGFEMSDTLSQAGLDATLIMQEDRLWGKILDPDGSGILERAMERRGVRLIRGAKVKEIRKGTENVVTLTSGASAPFDMMLIGIGSHCPHQWVADAGILVQKGIITNEFLETNIPNIWAAGDAAEFFHPVFGERVMLGNWVNAQVQGRIAGAGMAGQRAPMRLISAYTTSGFGIRVAFVGNVINDGNVSSITRYDKKENSYGRLFIKNGTLTGAALLNRTQELGIISKLIEKKIDITRHAASLANPSFSLSSIKIG